MMEDHALIFHYHRLNCYSFNALAGAIDGDPDLADITIALATTGDAVVARAPVCQPAWPRHCRPVQ